MSGREARAVVAQQLAQLCDQHLSNQLSTVHQAVFGRDVDQLDRLQLFRDGHGDAVRIHPIRLAVPVESQRRNDRYDTLREQRLKELGIDALDLAREQMVDTLDDAERVGDDHVRGGRAQIVGRQAFENLVSQAVGGRQRQLERRCIGDASAVEIRGVDVLLCRERSDLRRRAVNEHDPDIQRPEQRHVQQQRREVVVRDDAAVDRENERLLPELRNVLQDAPQIGQFHV